MNGSIRLKKPEQTVGICNSARLMTQAYAARGRRSWRSQQRNLELVLGLRNSVSDALTPIGDVTADVIS